MPRAAPAAAVAGAAAAAAGGAAAPLRRRPRLPRASRLCATGNYKIIIQKLIFIDHKTQHLQRNFHALRFNI